MPGREALVWQARDLLQRSFDQCIRNGRPILHLEALFCSPLNASRTSALPIMLRSTKHREVTPALPFRHPRRTTVLATIQYSVAFPVPARRIRGHRFHSSSSHITRFDTTRYPALMADHLTKIRLIL